MDPWIERGQRVMTPNYRPAPFVLERGEGVYVFDQEGRRYLDMVSGIAVSALGHGDPELVRAVREQAARLIHTSNLYWNQPSIALAELIVERSFGDRVFFCNSGAEANEACIKLARRWHHHQGHEGKVEIVTFRNSFHGRTLGALAATAQPKYHEGFTPLPGGFVYLDVGDEAGLVENTGPRTAAVLIEPVQGEGGVRPVPDDFMRRVRARCDEVGALLIVDEVQAGVGRTGEAFAYMSSKVKPDLMAMAKGMGGGLPVGAMVATEAVAEALVPGTHGTTYGGNPLVCAAALTVMRRVLEPTFMASVRARGERLLAGLRRIGERTGAFREIRGRGLIVGAEMADGREAKGVVEAARDRGVLIHVAGPHTLRLVPPLVIDDGHVDEALDAMEAAMSS